MVSKKFLITIPKDWRDEFSARAKKAGMSLGRWMAEQAKASLPKLTQGKLSEFRGPGKPPSK